MEPNKYRHNMRDLEDPKWIKGLQAMRYPIRCRNCYNFPTVLIKVFGGWVVDGKYAEWIGRRWCPFCGVEEYRPDVTPRVGI